ncbi:MAG: hypothetical protein M1818_005145 [Claussenomyces sp. TS43310]|nr:MAG: hypothetical protein M1818_005145 [Claussenomyces sp. TS43310]
MGVQRVMSATLVPSWALRLCQSRTVEFDVQEDTCDGEAAHGQSREAIALLYYRRDRTLWAQTRRRGLLSLLPLERLVGSLWEYTVQQSAGNTDNTTASQSLGRGPHGLWLFDACSDWFLQRRYQ